MGQVPSSPVETRYERTVWGEIFHRFDWIFFGTIGIVILCFIPVIGWLFAIGLFFGMMGKIFGKRSKVIVGDCPVCSTTIFFPEETVGGDCPACTKRLVIQSGMFVHY